MNGNIWPEGKTCSKANYKENVVSVCFFCKNIFFGYHVIKNVLSAIKQLNTNQLSIQVNRKKISN